MSSDVLALLVIFLGLLGLGIWVYLTTPEPLDRDQRELFQEWLEARRRDSDG